MMHGENKETEQVLAKIPSNGVGVEIGVWKGESSEKFLTKSKFLHLVDPYHIDPYLESKEFVTDKQFIKRYKTLVKSSNLTDFQTHYEAVFQSVVKKFSNSPVKIHRCTSNYFFSNFNEKVDWIYVDGSHEYKQVKKDLENCLKILNPNGKIFGDDYLRKPGVKQAVDEFVKENNFKLDNYFRNQFEVLI